MSTEDSTPTGNRIAFEFIDIFRIKHGQLVEHWTSMDLGALRSQMQRPVGRCVKGRDCRRWSLG